MLKKPDAIYLDFNASSPLLLNEAGGDGAFSFSALVADSLGNPSSTHSFGRRAKNRVRESTDSFAKFFGRDPNEVFWTSGATESNSWTLRSTAELADIEERKARILIGATEHESIQATARALEERGHQIETVRVCPSGLIDLDQLRTMLAQSPVDLVVIQFANNESGVIQPVREILSICNAADTLLHVDAVQALGKVRFDWKTFNPAFLSLSAHKIGALKGTGALLVNTEQVHEHKESDLRPLIAGKQQHSLRGGTENVMGIVAFAHALERLSQGFELVPAKLEALHRDFEKRLFQTISGTIVHGEKAPRLPNTSFVGFEGVEGDGLVIGLDLAGIAASAGSACSSGSLDPSPVLLAMGCDSRMARSSVRLSSGFLTRESDFERVLEVLPALVARARKHGLSGSAKTGGDGGQSKGLEFGGAS